MEIRFSFEELQENWPSPIIARDQQQLDKFSGGLLNARTLANEDSKGLGPKEKFKMGNKVFYSTRSLVEWMEERLSQ